MGFLHRLFHGSGASVPAAEVERLLRAHRAGTGSMEETLRALIRAKVFVLLHGKAEDAVSRASVRPLVLPSTHGHPSVYVFTNQNFAGEVQRQHPEFGAGMEVEFRWVLANCPDGAGLVLNPGTDLSIELPPGRVPVFQKTVRDGGYS
jgi:hypothetical protein